MRKNITLTLLAAGALLFSCGSSTSSNTESASQNTSAPASEKVSETSAEPVDTSSLKIVCPSGAPSVAFYNHSNDKNFETNAKPANIVSFMTSASDYDVVVIDTTSGVKAINNGAPYELAANITLGNFYIASTGNDEDEVMDENDTIVLFGQNQTADLVFHYIYGSKYDSKIEYVTAVSDAATCLASGKNVTTGSTVDYVFIAQPVLFATLNNTNAATYGKAKTYANIQDLYKEKSNGLSMIQASIFTKKTSDQAKINQFLKDTEADINTAISDPDKVVEGMNKISADEAKSLFGITGAAAKATLSNNNSLGLGYVNALSNKNAIDNFLSLFSIGATDEGIYHK